MSKVPVDDYGLEVIRKAAQNSEDNTKYDLRTVLVSGEKLILDKAQFEELLQVNQRILEQLKLMNVHLMLASNFEGEI